MPLVALAIGGLGGWLAASGWFVPVVRAEPQPTRQPAPELTTCSVAIGDCCGSEGRVSALARVEAHNAKVSANLTQAGKKPNIMFIMGDDIGMWNIGAYHRGLMAGRTPNLDKLAKEGMLFTDYYAEASCTAGRANFIMGQLPIRTGMTTVGQAGAKIGIPAEACTIATALKAQGYATGQFGKNHLGDLNEFLPTVHGFDEFFGYLYHLDAMEDPAHPNYPQELLNVVGPRNMVHSWASDIDDLTVMPRWGKIGKQKIEDAGTLYPKRMETVDDDLGHRQCPGLTTCDIFRAGTIPDPPVALPHRGVRHHAFANNSDRGDNACDWCPRRLVGRLRPFHSVCLRPREPGAVCVERGRKTIPGLTTAGTTFRRRYRPDLQGFQDVEDPGRQGPDRRTQRAPDPHRRLWFRSVEHLRWANPDAESGQARQERFEVYPLPHDRALFPDAGSPADRA
jgi:hypothetical protein